MKISRNVALPEIRELSAALFLITLIGSCAASSLNGIDTSVQSTYFFDPTSTLFSVWNFDSLWSSGFPTSLPELIAQ